MEQDIPDYDMDSEDERWLQSQAQRLELSPLKFEEMMDRLEKSSGQTVVNINEAKALLKEDDDLIIAVFDYWLNKRLKTQHPLILTVKTEQRAGSAANNPYLAFRRRTEKMQTRKNRKNDETSYEKMLKLRRDLHRAVTLLELVKKREKMKREHVHLTVEIFEKRYHARDFSGAIYAEASAIKTTRPAFTPIFHNHYTNQSWSNKAILKDEVIPRKEKRQYKKRKHKSLGHTRSGGIGTTGIDGLGTLSSDEEPMPQLSPEPEEVEDEGQFAFRRNKLCSYHMVSRPFAPKISPIFFLVIYVHLVELSRMRLQLSIYKSKQKRTRQNQNRNKIIEVKTYNFYARVLCFTRNCQRPPELQRLLHPSSRTVGVCIRSVDGLKISEL
jgi:enhancer of polycomb-like protein